MSTIHAHRLATGGCRWILGCPDAGGWQGYCRNHYNKMRNTGRLRTGHASIDTVRTRIRLHLARGGTFHGIAAASGVDPKTVEAIHSGRTTKVRATTADKILAAPIRPSNIGCVRRIQALRRIGWTQPGICAAAGISLDALGDALQRGAFTERHAVAISAAYEQLSSTRGPSRLATRIATKTGCAPPLAWDGIDIDDPVAVPDLGETRRRTPAELIAEYEHLTRLGVTPERAARQLKVLPESITQARHRAARLEVGEAA